MIIKPIHFLPSLMLSVLNIVLDYLIKPLPRWQVVLVWIALAASISCALIMSSFAPFLLPLFVSRPLPTKNRWKFALATGCLFYFVAGIPYQWLQAHGLM